jgi:hypothetical protein
MKKIFLFLLLVVSFTVTAQKTYSIEKPLQLNTVNEGAKSDSVLVRGTDKIVKYVPRSEFGGGSVTNLNYLASPTNGTILSSSGTPATVPLATTVNAGLFSPAEKMNLSNAILTSGDQTKVGTLSMTRNGTNNTYLLLNTSIGGVLNVANNVGSLGDGAVFLNQSVSGNAVRVDLNDTGGGLMISNGPFSNGIPFTVKNNSIATSYIDKLGNITGNSFVKAGGTAGQFLKANGTVDSNNYIAAIGGVIASRLTHTVTNSSAMELMNNSTSYDVPSIKITNASNNIGLDAAAMSIWSSGVNSNNVGIRIHTRTIAPGLSVRGINSGDILIEGMDNMTRTFLLNKLGEVKAKSYNVNSLNIAPLSATDNGVLGEIRITATHIYVCIGTNTWVRTALATW